MIAWLARLGVLTELVVLGALAMHLSQAGAGPLRIFACVIAGALAWRTLVVLLPFAVVLLHRLRDRREVVAGDFMRAIAGEWVAKSLSFGLYQPFEQWMSGPEPAPAKSPPGASPILLIHGYLCNRGSWYGVRRVLLQAWAGSVYTISLEPPLGSIHDYLPQVSAKVAQILQETGAAKVHLVCHSMGGLVVRAWLREDEHVKQVASLVTIGSPHHGTRLAGLGIGKNVKQMHEHSKWLKQLAAREQGWVPPFPVLCLHTEQDNLVYPPESGTLPWAVNESLRGIGHVELQSSRVVAERVERHLRAAEEVAAAH